jgi:hypothetical protein
VAIRVCKEDINQAAQSSLNAGLAYEVMAEALCFSSQDKSEGIQAFPEKRPPSRFILLTRISISFPFFTPFHLWNPLYHISPE